MLKNIVSFAIYCTWDEYKIGVRTELQPIDVRGSEWIYMQNQRSYSDLLSILDQPSADILQRLILNFREIEELAKSGNHYVLNLYLEIKIAVEKMDGLTMEQFIDAVDNEDFGIITSVVGQLSIA